MDQGVVFFRSLFLRLTRRACQISGISSRCSPSLGLHFCRFSLPTSCWWTTGWKRDSVKDGGIDPYRTAAHRRCKSRYSNGSKIWLGQPIKIINISQSEFRGGVKKKETKAEKQANGVQRSTYGSSKETLLMSTFAWNVGASTRWSFQPILACLDGVAYTYSN